MHSQLFPTHMFRQVHSIATQVSIDYIKKKYRWKS